MKHTSWKTLSSRIVYQNPWMRLREDVAEMPDGQTTIYGVVTFGNMNSMSAIALLHLAHQGGG